MQINTNIFKNKNLTSIILAIIISFIVFVGNFFVMGDLDKIFQSYYYRIKNDVKVNKNILVVEIDEKTLKNLGRFPFDRKIYTKLIENLNNAGALVIGFDIIFADKTDLMSDSYFAKSISKAKNIVLGGAILTKGENSIIFEKPLDAFLNGAQKIGYFTPELDTFNSMVYGVSPFKIFANNTYYEYFSISLLRAFYAKMYENKDYLTNKSYVENQKFLLNDKVYLPLSSKNSNDVLINFVDRSKFYKYSFFDLYDTKSFESIQSYVGQDFLKDKIVIIGATAKGIKDIFNTPYGVEYGVYIHANFINTVLNKNFLKYFDKTFEWILIFLLIILACYINLSKGGYFLISSNLSIFVIFIVIFPTIIINFTNLILNFPAELVLAFLLSSTLSNIVKYIIENKDKTKLNKALSEYVSRDIAKQILSGEGLINLNGEKKRVTIFFSDIEGFTTISERFSPEELISFLKDYLSFMSDIIFNQKGFINKYEGDAIMALWGVFSNSQENTSYEACITALIQQKKLKEANKNWKEAGLPQINVRMGINTGEAIIGNIGSSGKKIEFTAIGDSVNLASRLEGVNKFYGTFLCVSEAVYNDTKDFFEYRYLDKIRVKGKNNAINIYELLSYKGDIKSLDLNIYSRFQEGISFYLNKEFEKGIEVFEELSKINGDKPSSIYKQRCEFFIKNPPPDDWDKVWTMTEK